MSNVSICNSLLATRGLHGSTENDGNSVTEILFSIELVPTAVIHPLAKEFNRGLGSVLLFLGHVEVINENDGLLSKLWSIHSFTPSIHVSIDDILGLVGRGLC